MQFKKKFNMINEFYYIYKKSKHELKQVQVETIRVLNWIFELSNKISIKGQC